MVNLREIAADFGYLDDQRRLFGSETFANVQLGNCTPWGYQRHGGSTGEEVPSANDACLS